MTLLSLTPSLADASRYCRSPSFPPSPPPVPLASYCLFPPSISPTLLASCLLPLHSLPIVSLFLPLPSSFPLPIIHPLCLIPFAILSHLFIPFSLSTPTTPFFHSYMSLHSSLRPIHSARRRRFISMLAFPGIYIAVVPLVISSTPLHVFSRGSRGSLIIS